MSVGKVKTARATAVERAAVLLSVADDLNRELPEVMGAAEVADELGVASGNLPKVVGLPEAFADLRCGRIWRADLIRAFAAERRERRGRVG